jgi:hypothetical protein
LITTTLVAPLLLAVVALAAVTALLAVALPLALVTTMGSVTLFVVPLVGLVVAPFSAAFWVFDAAGLRVVTAGV